jgi:hypothetical protein
VHMYMCKKLGLNNRSWMYCSCMLAAAIACQDVDATATNLLQVKREDKNLLKTQPLPTALRMQAIRSKQLRNIYICYIHATVYET